MQHTVVAFFDTYAQAEAARDALVAAGLGSDSIALQARCEPTYATDASTVADTASPGEGFLASIERFFESLFASSPARQETAQYAEAVRRGAVMLSVDAASDVQCELAKTTLEHTGPIDIEERAATWCAPSDESLREHSPLDELGIRRSAAARQTGPVRSYARETPAQTPSQAGTSAAGQPPSGVTDANTLAAGGSAPGTGAAVAPKRGEPPQTAIGGAEEKPAVPSAPVPDEYLENEEDFRGKREDDGP